jgi:hypothetical protein
MENYKQWMEQKLTSEDMDKLPKVIKPLTQEQIQDILVQNKWNIGDNDGLTDIVNANKISRKSAWHCIETRSY